MKKLTVTGMVVVGTLLAGCAAYRPVFDPKFIRDGAQFEVDLQECQNIASTQRFTTGQGAMIGTGLGAGIGGASGAAIGSIFGDAGRGAAAGAIGGAIGGLIRGAIEAQQVEREIVVNCMSGRGYRPLH